MLKAGAWVGSKDLARLLGHVAAQQQMRTQRHEFDTCPLSSTAMPLTVRRQGLSPCHTTFG